MRKIDTIIVHCSASDYAHHDNVKTIREWHVDERGWSDIGYHKVILKSGEICQGRPDYRQGAHCRGLNAHSIGICLTGYHRFSSAQFESLRREIAHLCNVYGDLKVYPHSAFANKACPNFDLEKVLGMGAIKITTVKKKTFWTKIKTWFRNL